MTTWPERTAGGSRKIGCGPNSDADQLVEQEQKAEGAQHLVEMVARVELADRDALDHEPEQGGEGHGAGQRRR